MKLKLINGGLSVDERGMVKFCNDFQFEGVQRFYTIENRYPKLVRAWHGHRIESKWVTVLTGCAIIAVVKVDDWDSPGQDCKPVRYVMSGLKPQVLYIPPGYANGSMSLEDNTLIMHFSDRMLEESDDYRFPPYQFGYAVWDVKERYTW